MRGRLQQSRQVCRWVHGVDLRGRPPAAATPKAVNNARTSPCLLHAGGVAWTRDGTHVATCSHDKSLVVHRYHHPEQQQQQQQQDGKGVGQQGTGAVLSIVCRVSEGSEAFSKSFRGRKRAGSLPALTNIGSTCCCCC